jgi:ABC-type sugar transport system ATPase subunit
MNFLDAGAARSLCPVPDGVEVGIRPEHLRLDGHVPARVELVEVAGDDVYVHLTGGLVARSRSDHRPTEGDEVRLGVRREDVRLFDAVTGARIEP